MNIKYYWAKFLKKIRGSALKNCQIHSTAKIESGCNMVSLSMGRFSFCGYDCEMTNVKIGAFCSISNNVIIGGTMHPLSWVSTSSVFYGEKDSVKKLGVHAKDNHEITSIGNDVWIGQGAMIKQGVTVGHGAVIGMNSVVTKDVPAYTIVGGVPAKQIKKRFDDKTIENLLEINWWDLREDEIKSISSSIKNVEEFIEKVKKIKI